MMSENRTIFDRMLGLEEKRVWKAYETRAKNLGEDYYNDYKQMKSYVWSTGVTKWEDYKFIFEHLLDLLEECAIEKRKFTSITGPDVAGFLDEMIGDTSWIERQRQKLNKKAGKHNENAR